MGKVCIIRAQILWIQVKITAYSKGGFVFGNFWNICTYRRRRQSSRLLNSLIGDLLGGAHNITYADFGSSGGLDERWSAVSSLINVSAVDADDRSVEGGVASDLILLGQSDETCDFHKTRKQECSSIFSPNIAFLEKFPYVERFDVLEVAKAQKVVRYDTLDVCPPDFIKADIQGGELSALRGSRGLMHRTLGVEVEVEFTEIYQSQPLFNDVNQYLIDSSFEFIDFLNLYRWSRNALNQKGQAVFADALYMRTPEYVLQENLDWKKYICICALYKRFDLSDVIIKKYRYSNKNYEKLKKMFEKECAVSEKLHFFMKSFSGGNGCHLLY